MFIDEARVFVQGGRGGDGACSFHREKYRPKGGPDGGNGGHGGAVVFFVQESLASLLHLKNHPHKRGASGKDGARNNRTGGDAPDLRVPVPAGTQVRDDSGELLAELVEANEEFEVAPGGRGGRGNASFKTANYRLPGFAELGEPTKGQWLLMELRLIADVAIIGLPNAGKSTLVATVSAAKPKIANYPFTTLEPSLGVASLGDATFTVCDIPGLIEGAHKGKGLGTKFLRHTARSAAFCQLIDAASDDPIADYRAVRDEIEAYESALLDRPWIVALSKVDTVSADDVSSTIALLRAAGVLAIPFSSHTKAGLDELVETMHSAVARGRDEQTESAGFRLYRFEPDELRAKRDGKGWRLVGEQAERWASMTDMNNQEAVAYLHARLERAGSEKVLEKAGAKPGDDVHVGGEVFEWWPVGTSPA